MAATDYKGITIEFRGETTDLQRKLAQIREDAKTTFSGLRDVNRGLKFDDGSIVNLTQKQKYLQDAIKSTADRATAYNAALKALDEEAERNGGLTEKQQAQHDQLERSIEQCKRQIDQYSDELQKTTAQIDAHNSKLGQFGEKAETVGNNLQNAGKAMSSVGDNLTRYVTVPLAAGATVAIKAATDLDTSYHNLTKTVDGSDSELQKFKENAIELSKVQPVSANTILDVEALGAQLGYSNDNLESFAKTVTGLDIATDMDAETAAMELAHFSNIMGMAQEDTDRYGSTIVSLGNHFATTESDVSAMALRIAGAGKQLGLTEADVLGLATALTSMGINAEAGGTAISTVMSSIDKTVALGTDGLKKWAEIGGVSVDELIAHMSAGDDWAKEFAKSQNSTLKEMQGVTSDALWQLETWADTAKMSAEDFATAWKNDPVTALQAVFAGMEDATKEGSNMNLMLDDLGISSIRQTDMMKRLASNSTLVKDAVKDANDAWRDNTALSKEVDNRNESLASKFEVLKNRATAVAVEVGKPLADALLAALDAASPLIKAIENGAEAFAKMDKQQQAAIIQTVAFVAAAGPVLSVLGRVTEGVGSVVSGIGKFAQGIPVFTSGLQQGMGAVESLNLVSEGLGTTLSTGLFGIGIAAATIAVAAFIGYLVNWHEEQEKTRKSHEDFAASVTNLSDAVHGATTDLEGGKDAIKGLGDQANFTRDDLDALTEAQNRLADNIKQRNTETAQSIDSLEQARGIIEAYAGQTGLSADEQVKLRDAIETVNEQCGASYEVFDAANGKIREQGSDAEASAEQIGKLIDKQIEQIKTNALLENMQDVYKNYYDQLEKLNTLEIDLKETEEQRNAELEKLNDGDTTRAVKVAELNTHLKELNESHDQVRNSVDESVKHMDFYDQELQRIGESSGNTKSGLQALVESTAALHGKLSDDSASQKFTKQLEELGISVTSYADLSYTELQALADNYDGTTDSIRLTLDQFDKDAKASSKSTGEGIRANFTSSTSQIPSDTKNTFEQARQNMNGVGQQMQADAGNIGDRSGSNLVSRLGSWNSNAGSTARNMSNQIMGGVSGLEGELSGIGDRAGSGLTSNLSSSIYGGSGSVESAARSLASAQRAADVSGQTDAWGYDAGVNLSNGLNSSYDYVYSAANSIAMAVSSLLGHSVPKEGPLHEGGKGEVLWGQHMVQNIVKGVELEKPKLIQAMEQLADVSSAAFAPDVDVNAITGNAAYATSKVARSIEAQSARDVTRMGDTYLYVTFDKPVIREDQDMDVLVRKIEAKVNQIRESKI